jgi:hypothetical protein
MELINYSKRERFLIVCLSAALYALFLVNLCDGEWFELPLYYGSALLFLYGVLVFPVWKSDIQEGETEKDAEFRHYFPEIYDVCENTLKDAKNKL